MIKNIMSKLFAPCSAVRKFSHTDKRSGATGYERKNKGEYEPLGELKKPPVDKHILGISGYFLPIEGEVRIVSEELKILIGKETATYYELERVIKSMKFPNINVADCKLLNSQNALINV